MKIAIHHRAKSFSEGWIDYCKTHSIPYKIVNAYDSDIIRQISDCDVFMWHYYHIDYRDALFAKQLLFSLQMAGKKVFPDFNTNWHFDDKLGQKYMFEAISVPFVPTYVFYNSEEALQWIKNTSFPKVFKLRGGAGASNVKLVKNSRSAKNLINRSFHKGFSQFNSIGYLNERISQFLAGKDSAIDVIKGIARLFIKPKYARMHAPEKGYIYFQDFIPNNNTDTRIVVVGDKIIGERRGVRKGDFRASGSHILLPDVSAVDIRCVKMAYEVSQKLKLQIGVFDFIHDVNSEPLMVEVSYGTDPDYTECEGYWTPDLNFIKSHINLSEIIIESFLKK